MSSFLKENYDIDSNVKLSKKDTSVLTITKKKDFKIIESFIQDVDFLERK